jgi:four helix bundle protein
MMSRQRKKIVTHRDLEVYQKAFAAAMRIFELSKSFPKEELYSLTDQIRRSSRSVCANMAEGWRKRRYEKAFASKFSDAEGEAAETQVWLEFAPCLPSPCLLVSCLPSYNIPHTRLFSSS